MHQEWARFDADYEYSILTCKTQRLMRDVFKVSSAEPGVLWCVQGALSGLEADCEGAFPAVQSYLERLDASDPGRTLCGFAQALHAFLVSSFGGRVTLAALLKRIDLRGNVLEYLNIQSDDPLCYRSSMRQFVPVCDGSRPRRSGVLGGPDGCPFVASDVVSFRFEDGDFFLSFTHSLRCLVKSSGDIVASDSVSSDVFEILGYLLRSHSGSGITLPYVLCEELSERGYTMQSDDLSISLFHKTGEDKNLYRFELRPELEEAEQMGEEISDILTDDGWDLESTTKIELLINEYCSNLITHSEQDESVSQPNILCTMRLEPSSVKLTFYSHAGQWNLLNALNEMDAQALLDERNASFEEHGRGLPIIKLCSPKIEFRQNHGLNETIFTIPRTSHNN